MTFNDLMAQVSRFQFLQGIKTTQIRMGLRAFQEYMSMTSPMHASHDSPVKSKFDGLEVIYDPTIPTDFVGFLCAVKKDLAAKVTETIAVLCHSEQDKAWFEWASQFVVQGDLERAYKLNSGSIVLENLNRQYIRITEKTVTRGFVFSSLCVIGFWKQEDIVSLLIEANRCVKK